MLTHSNTSFANINAAKDVWWLKIDMSHFTKESHILLARDSGLVWLRIAANTFPEPQKIFSKRQDKDSVSIEICGDDTDSRYMRDTRSGGTEYDFRRHVEYEWDDVQESTGTTRVRFPTQTRAVVSTAAAQSVIHSDAEIMGGTPVFVGTRVPVKALFDCMAANYNLTIFKEDFPSVRHITAVNALALARDELEQEAYAAATR